ncbi:hypothetical protein O6H91_04G089100 [Diphasiastrum complanatum]|uniref:Uncharacterized protein n=1 Tax=Diphasiastrum complanatum TaxID=34168 RepID=A0ACC2DYZ8_DIPCM|nr:hypothetical protein O6H91_04G089100 [Diphasiastrum complanatum]
MEPAKDLRLQKVHKQLEDCSVTGSWIFSIAGALLAIPVGIKRKSLAPLLFFGTTGAMLDIWVTVSNCEREYQEKMLRAKEQHEERQKESSCKMENVAEDTFSLDETSGEKL